LPEKLAQVSHRIHALERTFTNSLLTIISAPGISACQSYIEYGADEAPLADKTANVHTEKGVKLLLALHLSRLISNTQNLGSNLPSVSKWEF
jgi:hypothetical protein